MAEYRKVFEIKSKFKNYRIEEFHDFNLFLDHAQSFDLIIVDKSLKSYFQTAPRITYLECTEKTKSWEGLKVIFDIFVTNNLTRKSKVLIVGGGVLQDSVSFCCSVFNRGIEFEFAPSTLLAMVDSCIGGKTSINYGKLKNKLGNFYPPNKIHIVSNFISTLPLVEIYSGLGEIFKFHVLQFNYERLGDNLANPRLISNDLIFECLRFKASIIQIDEFDQGSRLTLNFGHTFGHAIESMASFRVPHGIGVVLGITIANEIGFQMGMIAEKTKLNIEKYAKEFLLLVTWDKAWFDFKEVLLKIKMDKKNLDTIRMILLDEPGQRFVLKTVDNDLMEKSMNQIIERLKLV
jgi:3-dehydroquinate synthase